MSESIEVLYRRACDHIRALESAAKDVERLREVVAAQDRLIEAEFRSAERAHAETATLRAQLAATAKDTEILDWLLAPEKRGHDPMSIAVFHKNRGAGWITDRAQIIAAMQPTHNR